MRNILIKIIHSHRIRNTLNQLRRTKKLRAFLLIGNLAYKPIIKAVGTKVIKGKIEYTREKETIIMVSHEASITGAPILAFNVINKLKEKYNIITILMRGGL